MREDTQATEQYTKTDTNHPPPYPRRRVDIIEEDILVGNDKRYEWIEQ
jgi:hypothetical protein